MGLKKNMKERGVLFLSTLASGLMPIFSLCQDGGGGAAVWQGQVLDGLKFIGRSFQR